MHGARGGAPTGKRNGRYKHGAFTLTARYAQKEMRALIDECNELLDQI